MECRSRIRRAFVNALFACFGLGAWLTVNSVYAQLPVLLQTSPEGWTLPSYLLLILQMGNVGPIIYSSLCKCKLDEGPFILAVMILNSVGILVIAFFYNTFPRISVINSSLPLFVLFSFISLACCTSSVMFWPWMNHFSPTHLVPFMVGEGLSNLIPSLLALAQGIGGEPSCDPNDSVQVPSSNYSTTVFFIVIFVFMCLSTVSFYVLMKYSSLFDSGTTDNLSLTAENSRSAQDELKVFLHLPLTQWIFLLVMLTILSAFANGALPSIQSYSSQPYGNIAYHLSVNLSGIANPVACLLSYFIPITSLYFFLPGLFLTYCFIVYVITIAVLSPTPPLQHSKYGIIINVIAWILCTGFVSISKLSIAAKLRIEGKRGLFWYGIATQIGASVGAIVMFFVINYGTVFKSYNPC